MRPLPWYGCLLLAFGFVVLSVAAKLGLYLGADALARPYGDVISGALGVGGLMVVTWMLVRRRPAWVARDLVLLGRPTGRGLARVLVAAAAGAGLFAGVYLMVFLVGGVEVSPKALPLGDIMRTVGLLTLGVVLNATWEELTFRGWPFAALVERFGPHPTALSLGAIFGLVHLLNDGWTALSILSVAVAGWLLSYSMLVFRSLAVPIGIHIGWNLCQSLLLSKQLWEVTYAPEAWRSGGAGGLEGSIAGVGITGAALVVLLVLYRRRGRPRTHIDKAPES